MNVLACLSNVHNNLGSQLFEHSYLDFNWLVLCWATLNSSMKTLSTTWSQLTDPSLTSWKVVPPTPRPPDLAMLLSPWLELPEKLWLFDDDRWPVLWPPADDWDSMNWVWGPYVWWDMAGSWLKKVLRRIKGSSPRIGLLVVLACCWMLNEWFWDLVAAAF